jgi:Zn-dependent peptidase ImmA (M78 family)
MSVRRKYISDSVNQLLTKLHIRRAPIQIEKLTKDLGITIQKEMADDELSGFLYRNREHNFTVIGVNAGHAETRQRFTIAHEIGHFFLHELDEIHIDREKVGVQVWRRNEESRQGTNSQEVEANLFAAELLMPSRFISRDLESIRVTDCSDEKIVEHLAELYQVSEQAMTIRLTNLGYLRL